MSWWNRLKGWQKGAIVIGGFHFLLYMIVLFLSPAVSGFMLVFLEWPWMIILESIHFDVGEFLPPTYSGMAILGIIGSLVYAVLTSLIILVISFIQGCGSSK